MNQTLHEIRKTFRNPRFCVVSAWLAATCFAFFLTAVQGVPVPAVHDEFAYLLGADTYAHGRVTNPTHPLWQHFETFHVIHQPTYIPKYQPAQSLTIAVGQLLGGPHIGVCLATGVSIAALVWMLTGWLPRKYFWLVWLFCVFHPGLQILWGQSYWGGAVPLTGASLLLGALGRTTHKMERRFAVVAAIGILLLANSRPFEGAVLTGMVGLGLVWKLTRHREFKLTTLITQVLGPCSLVLGVGALAMAANNYSVTGNALKMPYRAYEASYGWSPLFLWQTAKPKPEYRHPEMELYYTVDKTTNENTFRSWGDIWWAKSKTSADLAKFFCGGAELLTIVGLPLAIRRPRFRFALIIMTPVFLAALTTPWAWAHYGAPAAPLLILLMFRSWIEIWSKTHSPKLRVVRWAIIGVIPVFFSIWFSSIFLANGIKARGSWASHRLNIERKLLAEAGQDLVLVRYSNDHDPNYEWVYNAANIDAAGVVWAREISDQRRRELLHYFSDRNIWVVDADAKQPILTRFPEPDRSQQDCELGLNSINQTVLQ